MSRACYDPAGARGALQGAGGGTSSGRQPRLQLHAALPAVHQALHTRAGPSATNNLPSIHARSHPQLSTGAGMESMFAKMAAAEAREGGDRTPGFLRTHPHSAER